MNKLQSTGSKTAFALFIGLSLLFVVMIPVLANAVTSNLPQSVTDSQKFSDYIAAISYSQDKAGWAKCVTRSVVNMTDAQLRQILIDGNNNPTMQKMLKDQGGPPSPGTETLVDAAKFYIDDTVPAECKNLILQETGLTGEKLIETARQTIISGLPQEFQEILSLMKSRAPLPNDIQNEVRALFVDKCGVSEQEINSSITDSVNTKLKICAEKYPDDISRVINSLKALPAKESGAVLLPNNNVVGNTANDSSNKTAVARGPGKIVPCGGDGQEPCTFAHLVTLGNNIINFLIYDVAAPFAVLLFMWAGFIFMFQSSNSGEVSRAKGIFFNVVIGFVLALAAFIIIKLILLGLNVDKGLYDQVKG